MLLAGVLSCAGLAACGDDVEDPRVADVANATEDGEAVGGSLADQSDVELGGQPEVIVIARLGAIVLALDDAELAQAEVALDRSADPRVIDFAQRMLAEHGQNADELEDLLEDRRITPADNVVAGALDAEAEAGVAELETVPARRVDLAYMRMQVKMHVAAGILIERLIEHAPIADAGFRGFLTATRDVIADHQAAAEVLLREL